MIPKIVSVARWEYLEKVKSKAFLIGLFLTPLVMVGMGVIPTLLITQADTRTKIIGVIDPSGTVFAPLSDLIQARYRLADGRPNYVLRPLASGPSADLAAASSEADKEAGAGDIEGYCLLGPTPEADTAIEYRSKSVGDIQLVENLQQAIRIVLSERKGRSMGLDTSVIRALNVRVDLKQVKLSKTGEKEDTGFLQVFFTAYVFLFMLFLLIVTSGQLLVRSILEEKSNRIVEVLVSSCSSTELMAGKVLGLSALGFTQIGFWSLMGAAASLSFGIVFVTPGIAALLVLYFVLGYLFYAAVFIGAGSPLTTEQEAQQVTSYLVMILVLPIALAFPAMQNPDATWLRILTFVPFLTPTMMALRIPIQMPSAWEILATILLMIVSIIVAMVAAGRIFRIAILSTGKSPKIAEILRWAKEG
ncbi:MAG TPA: ABC transporter permease [Bacteroidota bacterium]|nr:ABC transporter permease [Bacteroidota bacterium]